MLALAFTKLSAERHRFAYRRPDGSGEARELETRSFLLHDLIHLAVESEAGLTGGFYGRLARGADLDRVASEGDREAMDVERIVAVLTGWLKNGLDPEVFVAETHERHESIGAPCPAWFTVAFVEGAAERLRGLRGRWRATPFGGVMETAFPLP